MFEIEATSSTPHIRYDEGTHTLSVSGESYPENSFEFYAQVFEWLAKTLESAPLFRLSLEVSYMRRVWFRARGRADMLIKRMCHISVTIDEIGKAEA